MFLQKNYALSISLILMLWRQTTLPNNLHYYIMNLMGGLKNVAQGMVSVPMRCLGMGNPVLIPKCSERYFINSSLTHNMLLWSSCCSMLRNIFLMYMCLSTHVAILLMFLVFEHPQGWITYDWLCWAAQAVEPYTISFKWELQLDYYKCYYRNYSYILCISFTMKLCKYYDHMFWGVCPTNSYFIPL